MRARRSPVFFASSSSTIFHRSSTTPTTPFQEAPHMPTIWSSSRYPARSLRVRTDPKEEEGRGAGWRLCWSHPPSSSSRHCTTLSRPDAGVGRRYDAAQGAERGGEAVGGQGDLPHPQRRPWTAAAPGREPLLPPVRLPLPDQVRATPLASASCRNSNTCTPLSPFLIPSSSNECNAGARTWTWW